MPNKNSHAQHQPQRTCVACRTSKDASGLLSFFVLREGIVFDPARKIQRRKNYVCPDPTCLTRLDKWKRQYHKRHFNISGSEPVFTRQNRTAEQGRGQ